ncbi:hypothetical protein [Devosia sp. MC521]|uniref:hypothetical protein n=1 Tax=Devosia sp. MC521 TaxID=2759954 RepID=UPI0015FC147D|nr:hypothetical protein [Devosia sp. MC521]MBJ6989005.1 hypothetical protein [Devosia sp. MC521]QMW62964.1 hypothetical protein H4N61_00925 [Devosia sp. MC521]
MAHEIKRIFGEAKDYLAKPKKANTLDRYRRIWKLINQSGLRIVEYIDYVALTAPGQFVLTRSATIHGLWKFIIQKILSANRQMIAGLMQASADALTESRRRTLSPAKGNPNVRALESSLRIGRRALLTIRSPPPFPRFWCRCCLDVAPRSWAWV